MQSDIDNILISVIIPAFNAASTLERAVKSLGISEVVEILIIENGSTDNTREIAEGMAQKDRRIHIYESEKGVSRARNVGLDHARGRWISFLDADDYFVDHALEKMCQTAETENADIYLFGHFAGNIERKLTSEKSETLAGDSRIDGIVRMLENPTLFMQVWAKLFKSSIIHDNTLIFDPDLSLAEDSDFTLRYVMHVQSIFVSGVSVYQYTLNPHSVMRSHGDDKLIAYERSMVQSKKAVECAPELIQKALQKYILMHYNIAMVRGVFAKGNRKPFHNRIGTMKATANKPVFQEAIESTKLMDCCSLRMLPFLMIRLKLWYAVAAIYMIRAAQNYRREVSAQLT